MIVELNTESSLTNVLSGIFLNSDQALLNKATKDIIIKDLLTYKACRLVNCYTKKEFMYLLRNLTKDGKDILVKEVIINNQNLGIVRELEGNLDLIEMKLYKRFRYYSFVKLEKSYLCLTFNPESNLLRELTVKLEKGVISCSTLQTSEEELRQKYPEYIKLKDLVINKEVETDIGNIRFYNLVGGVLSAI